MKNTSKTWYWSALALFVAALIYYAQERDVYGQYLTYQESVTAVHNRGGELTALQKREKALVQRVEGLDSDPIEMEAAIRRSKHLVRKGERIFRVRLLDSTEASDPEPYSHEEEF